MGAWRGIVVLGGLGSRKSAVVARPSQGQGKANAKPKQGQGQLAVREVGRCLRGKRTHPMVLDIFSKLSPLDSTTLEPFPPACHSQVRRPAYQPLPPCMTAAPRLLILVANTQFPPSTSTCPSESWLVQLVVPLSQKSSPFAIR